MPVLHVDVKNKVATFSGRSGGIVCGNADYSIQFAFDTEWDSAERKTARFIWNRRYVDIGFTGDTCPIPVIEGADSLQIGVYTDGDLRTTTPASVRCYRSILDEKCDPLQEDEADETYATIAQVAAEEAAASAALARSAAERAEGMGMNYPIVFADTADIAIVNGGYYLLEPETFYVFGEVDSLAIYRHEPDDGRVHEFAFEFTPSEFFTGLSFYGTAPQWTSIPSYDAGKTCQVSVVRGIGVSICAV